MQLISNRARRTVVSPMAFGLFLILIWEAVCQAGIYNTIPIMARQTVQASFSAIAASSPELVLRSFGARKIDVLLIPRALPQFFGSIKLAITGALIGTIVTETVAASTGIGYVMVVATNRLDGPLAFAGLAMLAGLGVTLYVASTLLDRRLTGWAYRRQ